MRGNSLEGFHLLYNFGSKTHGQGLEESATFILLDCLICVPKDLRLDLRLLFLSIQFEPAKPFPK
jgi:hypothetical protein